MPDIIGWACLSCGVVYARKRDRDECEHRHAGEYEKAERNAMEEPAHA